LGFHADARNYDDAIEILHYYHLQQVDLISNNPIKQKSLEDAGFTVSIQSLPSKENDFNSKYLNDKKNIGKHTIITEQ
jgi:3,4-dihydroxy 2-butanone 4-phosphate synthase/GTP cyclohydrolase II